MAKKLSNKRRRELENQCAADMLLKNISQRMHLVLQDFDYLFDHDNGLLAALEDHEQLNLVDVRRRLKHDADFVQDMVLRTALMAAQARNDIVQHDPPRKRRGDRK